jgi:hypothetical protein
VLIKVNNIEIDKAPCVPCPLLVLLYSLNYGPASYSRATRLNQTLNRFLGYIAHYILNSSQPAADQVFLSLLSDV